MSLTIIKGTILSAPALGQLEAVPGGYLVAVDGRHSGHLPGAAGAVRRRSGGGFWGRADPPVLRGPAPSRAPVSHAGHGHGPALLDWLNAYAFPTEARFADTGYAREIYRRLARELIENGTTRVCMFSSLHTDATLILMEELEKAGVTGYVGKVNMDRNAAPGVLEETTEESMRETLRWLEASRDFRLVKPMLTPRFTPSCTDELMAFLGRLAAERDLPVQSHLSENQAEMAWVRQLHPDCQQYWETYAKYGLWNDRTVMAHCVWSDVRERQAMGDAGVTAVHCADSNQNICSGVAPVRAMLNEGVKVALGSDIAGGDHLHMFDVVAASIQGLQGPAGAGQLGDGLSHRAGGVVSGHLRRGGVLWRAAGLCPGQPPPCPGPGGRPAVSAPPPDAPGASGAGGVSAAERRHPGGLERRAEGVLRRDLRKERDASRSFLVPGRLLTAPASPPQELAINKDAAHPPDAPHLFVVVTPRQTAPGPAERLPSPGILPQRMSADLPGLL